MSVVRFIAPTPLDYWATGGWITNNDSRVPVTVSFEATLQFPDGHVVIGVPQQATVAPGDTVRYHVDGPLPDTPTLPTRQRASATDPADAGSEA